MSSPLPPSAEGVNNALNKSILFNVVKFHELTERSNEHSIVINRQSEVIVKLRTTVRWLIVNQVALTVGFILNAIHELATS